MISYILYPSLLYLFKLVYSLLVFPIGTVSALHLLASVSSICFYLVYYSLSVIPISPVSVLPLLASVSSICFTYVDTDVSTLLVLVSSLSTSPHLHGSLSPSS